MEFEEVDRIEALPPLAWSLTVNTGRLRVGSGVEVEGDTCFEGARSMDDLLGDGFVFGSGVVRRGDRYICVPPTHTLDGLYVVVHDTADVIVTNSLVWALRQAGFTGKQAGHFETLTQGLRSASYGIGGYRRRILPLRDISLFQMLYSPFELSADDLAERPIQFPRRYELDFATYKALLVDTVRATKEYSPRYGRLLSTCSTGYDSTACTAVGKEVGLELALTVTTGRGDKDDSGETVAKQMGVPVKTFDRPGSGLERRGERVRDWFVDLATVTEATGHDYSEFIAALANHGDIYFKAFEEHLPGSVLLTGFNGRIWDYMNWVSPWLRKGDSSGAGLNEFRLRVGFVHVPMTYIGARQARAIERLSQSAEMAPWRHGNPYNRPIARRLVEEAGGERESFGISKRAANPMVEAGLAGLLAAYERVVERYV